jgi:hypothetical protein
MAFKQISNEMCTLVVQASSLAAGEGIDAITQSSGSSAVLKFRALTTTEQGAITIDPTYKSAMQKDAFCNISSFNEAEANFALSANWSQRACSRWQELMLGNSSTYSNTSEAVAEVTTFVGDLFAANKGTSCTTNRSW